MSNIGVYFAGQMWGRGLAGETATEEIGTESDLSSGASNSGWSPLVLPSLISDTNILETDALRRHLSKHSLTRPPAFPILTLAESGTTFPNVFLFFPFRSLHPDREAGEREGPSVQESPSYLLCLDSPDLLREVP